MKIFFFTKLKNFMERVHEITKNFQGTRKNEFGSQKKNLQAGGLQIFGVI